MTILRGRQGGEWTHEDRVLAVAHVMAEDLVCSGCGQPKHEAYNPDSEGWYSVHEAECSGCKELAVDADAQKDKFRAERKVWLSDDRPPDVKLMPWSP